VISRQDDDEENIISLPAHFFLHTTAPFNCAGLGYQLSETWTPGPRRAFKTLQKVTTECEKGKTT
jgi:hypothetical protein